MLLHAAATVAALSEKDFALDSLTDYWAVRNMLKLELDYTC